MPLRCRVSGISIIHNTPSTDTDPVVYEVMINGVASGLSVSVPGNSAGATQLGSVAVAPNDRIAVRVSKALVVNPAVADVTAVVTITQ